MDLQDVGTRIYTYLYTTSYVMEAAAEQGKTVIVLDRPNPIGGVDIQGPTLDPAYRSFVGLYPMPTRHGLTIAEAARWMNERHPLNSGRRCALEVVSMTGWDRRSYWDELGLVFVMPSPIDGEAPGWHDGAYVRATGFLPTFQKHAGKVCLGVFVHPFDRAAFNPVRTGLSLIHGIATLYPRDFRWKEPPYEYETEKLPIDVIAGGPWVRDWVEGKHGWEDLAAKERADAEAFTRDRGDFLLY